MTAGEQERSEVHDPYLTWDGPYVLGALDPDERHEFEMHLSECDACRTAVAELAGLPGLLARVPVPDIFDELMAEVGEDSDFGFPPLPESLRNPLLPEPPPAPARHLEAVPDEIPTTESRQAESPQTESHQAESPQPEAPQDESPEAMLPDNVIDLQRARSRRREWATRVAVAAAAAAIGVGATLGLHSNPTTTTQPQVVAARSMEPAVATPITANFQLIDEGGGNTRVDLVCRYGAGPGAGSYSGWYSMSITTTAGATMILAWWPVKPGETVHLNTVADVPANQIRSVAIWTKDTNTMLLSGTV